jgi:hypothetical protein
MVNLLPCFFIEHAVKKSVSKNLIEDSEGISHL